MTLVSWTSSMTGNMIRIPEISTIKYKYSTQLDTAWTKLTEEKVTKL